MTHDTAERGAIGLCTALEAVKEIHQSQHSYLPTMSSQTAADSLTASGYIRAGLDMQTINVTAIPATGRDTANRSKSGYGFLLNDRGTISYDPTPDEIWKYVLNG